LGVLLLLLLLLCATDSSSTITSLTSVQHPYFNIAVVDHHTLHIDTCCTPLQRDRASAAVACPAVIQGPVRKSSSSSSMTLMVDVGCSHAAAALKQGELVCMHHQKNSPLHHIPCATTELRQPTTP
jgi:hypothetical protein